MMKLPQYDRKTYREILSEAIGRIPSLTDKWTDFNPQDTGVLLLETMAALTELQNYYLDQAGEEFLLLYMGLVNGKKVAGNALPEALHRFGYECSGGSAVRAVTLKEYEALAKGYFGIDDAHAAFQNGGILLTVSRSTGALDQEELQKLMQMLDSMRLVGTRIILRQAPPQHTYVTCRVGLDARFGRTQQLKEKLVKLFQQAVSQTASDGFFDEAALRAKLIALPEVSYIAELSFSDAEDMDAAPCGDMMAMPGTAENMSATDETVEHLTCHIDFK